MLPLDVPVRGAAGRRRPVLAHVRIVCRLLEGAHQAEAGKGVGAVRGGTVTPLAGVAQVPQETRGAGGRVEAAGLRLGRRHGRARTVPLLALA
ncbi:hypothetical protein SHKM778_36680 [Streptomyces sp. KM77-8]|uniref:Uncharacterized protein n=1 Tax=Streptomyces haneummycinicus TaxID=3074435 RepID=A0AAT9HIU5_9ACTN